MVDLWALAAAGVLAVQLSNVSLSGISTEDVVWLAASAPAWVLLAGGAGLYHAPERRIDQSLVEEVVPVFTVSTIWIWLLTLGQSITGSPALASLAVLWLLSIVSVLGLRSLLRYLGERQKWFHRQVALIGNADDNRHLLQRIQRHPEWGLEVVAEIVDRPEGLELAYCAGDAAGVTELLSASEAELDGTAISLVVEAVASLGVGRVIISGRSPRLQQRSQMMQDLVASRVWVDFVPGGPETLLSTADLHNLEGFPILTIEPIAMPRTAAVVKRAIDLAIAGVLLVVLAPLFAYVGLRIKLESSGPVLYRGRRIGRWGEEFEMLKFRTMTENSDALRHKMLADSISVGLFKMRDDPRVTPFGGRLRRRSIDELPQLWNVLRGDMSLVGPRPMIPEEAKEVGEAYASRWRARPGITGPWQTMGRSQIGIEDMLKLDYIYATSWTLTEDMRLLARTAGAILNPRGAY